MSHSYTHFHAGHYDQKEHALCARGNGRSYVGSVRRTRSGRDCQSWGSQSPHRHPFLQSTYYPELINRFACRNPGGVGAGPWCYTSDPNVRWEYCDVPQCGRLCSSIHVVIVLRRILACKVYITCISSDLIFPNVLSLSPPPSLPPSLPFCIPFSLHLVVLQRLVSHTTPMAFVIALTDTMLVEAGRSTWTEAPPGGIILD